VVDTTNSSGTADDGDGRTHPIVSRPEGAGVEENGLP
jgi:hypothetical protein